MTGLRKFWAFVLSLASFTTIMLMIPTLDPFNLGLAIGAILGAFSSANAFVHIKGKQDNKEK